MTVTITTGAQTMRPKVIHGYDSKLDTGNRIHQPIGATGPAVTFGFASLRSGSWEFLFDNGDDASAAFELHGIPGVFVLTDTDFPWANMRYVPSGAISIQLDPETQAAWFVRVEYQEVQ